MNKYIWIILSVVLVSMRSDDDRRSLLSHKWLQFAYKPNMASSPQIIHRSKAEKLVLKTNGDYLEDDGKVKTIGNWYLSPDQTKMEFIINTTNGLPYPPYIEDLQSRQYNILILKLNNDTLVYRENYHVSTNYEDWYFVREDK